MTIRRLAGLTWAVLILVFYYRRAWRLLAAGPAAWDVHGFFGGGWRLPWPWAAEAAWRASQAMAGALAVFAAAWMLGAWVLRLVRCRPHDPVDARLFRLAAGLAGLSYFSLALAAFGWYRRPVVGVVVVALAVAGVFNTAHGALSRHRRHGARPSRQGPDRPPEGWRLHLALVVVALAMALLAALAPETEYDALWYHLWLPHLWLQHGRPVDVLTEFVALYPLGWELLYGDAMALGGAVAAKLLHFACLPLLAAATWQLTRRFFRRVPPMLAAGILVTAPTVMWEATTAYVDLALALYVTLGIYALLMRQHERQAGAAAGWGRLAVLCLGFAAAIKHLGLVVVALALLTLLARAAARFAPRGPHPQPGGWRRHLPRGARREVVGAVALAAVAMAIGFPWYWRAWTASGNPFFPELFSLFGARPPQRWDAVNEAALAAFKAHFGFGRSLQSLLLLPWNVTQHGAIFRGALGPIFLLAAPGVVGAIFTGLRGRVTARHHVTDLKPTARATQATLVFIVVGYVAAWASPLSSFQLRFLVPIVPLMSVLAAIGLTDLVGRLRPPSAVAWIVAALLALNLPPFTPLHEGDRRAFNGWLTHVVRALPFGVVAGRESEDAYLRREVPTYGAWQHLAAPASEAPPSPVLVLEVGGGDNFYATRPKVPADSAFARGAWAEGAGADDVVRRTLARLGVTHVLFDRRELRRMTSEGAALASPALRERDLTAEYEDAHALLYRVAPLVPIATARNLRPN